MAELAYLGSLLGLPDVLDPVFPLAYTAFFGDLPPGSKTEEQESGEAAVAVEAIHSDNVSPFTVEWLVGCCCLACVILFFLMSPLLLHSWWKYRPWMSQVSSACNTLLL